MISRRPCWDSAVLSVALVTASMAFVQPAKAACASLTPIAGPEGYRARTADPRCEGLYFADVAGSQIELVSLTLGPLSYDLDHPTTLQVRPVTPATVALSVQAVGIMPGLHYRMDADIEPGQALNWPIGEVLVRLRIPAELVGVLGIRHAAGNPAIFVPVQVAAPGGASASPAPVIAVLRPLSGPLGELRWRFTPAGQVAAGPWQTLTMQNYKAEIALTGAREPLDGQLQVSWNDPATGMFRAAMFNLGP
jgi:hypothetical protein